jgi:hypothetical protein
VQEHDDRTGAAGAVGRAPPVDVYVPPLEELVHVVLIGVDATSCRMTV